ncbi:MAG: leucyl aminopeptidase, partial [Burkholderiales bacterium]|nr:leucyl aminopeptidase [Burkholderiales bacterium]
EITLQNKSTNKTNILFCFTNEYLKNAKSIQKTNQVNTLINLEKAGTIAEIFIKNASALVVSLGAKNDFSYSTYVRALNALGLWLNTNNTLDGVNIILEDELAKIVNLTESSLVEQSIFNLLNGIYYLDTFKSKTKSLKLKTINFVTKVSKEADLNNALVLFDSIVLIKDLANAPANVVTPSYIANVATTIAKSSKKVKLEILGRKEMTALGMNCILAVAQGTKQEPKFITLNYTGASAKVKPIVLVGKGVTFDSGGISLKPGLSMEEMKYDMCGAATIIGAFKAVVAMNLPINLVVITPCTENLPSDAAVKPGDIVTSMSGQTVEIINTDAEGRLILCDALTYAKKFKPQLVIDFATLTGAMAIALGTVAAGLFTQDNKLAKEIIAAGLKANDPVWQMPLYPEFNNGLASSVADFSNISSSNPRSAGSSMGATFLAKFTCDYRWAHIDIANVSWHYGSGYNGSNSVGGATGRPFNLIMEFLRNQK